MNKLFSVVKFYKCVVTEMLFSVISRVRTTTFCTFWFHVVTQQLRKPDQKFLWVSFRGNGKKCAVDAAGEAKSTSPQWVRVRVRSTTPHSMFTLYVI